MANRKHRLDVVSRSPRFVVVVVVKSSKLLSLKELRLKVFFFECDFILLHRKQYPFSFYSTSPEKRSRS